jgi:hypothetical protein
MAEFCIATGMTPTEYRNLTLAEYVAFCDAIRERSRP